ncbi:081de431-4f4a-4e45-8ac6-3aed666b255c [Thermothielavioides terrestris]|nr:081de431-4f4a-4e45-8ac6-3aed666b255c [Thermothielavioides terrestris]
MSSYDLI